jgi:hypothetical protein
MPLTFFEFATLALLASISYWLMHESIKRELGGPDGGVEGYWGIFIFTPFFIAIPIALLLGTVWLVFAGLNWLFSAL